MLFLQEPRNLNTTTLAVLLQVQTPRALSCQRCCYYCPGTQECVLPCHYCHCTDDTSSKRTKTPSPFFPPSSLLPLAEPNGKPAGMGVDLGNVVCRPPAPCNIERITDGQNVMRNIRTQTLRPPLPHALGRGEEVGLMLSGL